METNSSLGEKMVLDARPHRLMISNMILENFKSYAGVQEIGPFHKSFSRCRSAVHVHTTRITLTFFPSLFALSHHLASWARTAAASPT